MFYTSLLHIWQIVNVKCGRCSMIPSRPAEIHIRSLSDTSAPCPFIWLLRHPPPRVYDDSSCGLWIIDPGHPNTNWSLFNGAKKSPSFIRRNNTCDTYILSSLLNCWADVRPYFPVNLAYGSNWTYFAVAHKKL